MGLDNGYAAGIGSLKPGVCTSTTRPASPYQGQVIYETDTNSMKAWNGSSWNGVGRMRKIAAFTTGGTWTVPSGVTYAIAYIRGGGGGIGSSASGTGGTSSVAFASGTVSATGGLGQNLSSLLTSTGAIAGTANSGQGAAVSGYWAAGGPYLSQGANGPRDGAFIVAGADVAAGASITVTVGSGGVAGAAFSTGSGAAGGSGYVYIEYEV